MRLRMSHIASGLAAAVLLVIVFMAAGVIVVAALAATIAAGLIALIAYRVARNALSRAGQERRIAQDTQPAVPPPAA
jgi:TRAP-type mannitol/chloroaromatic compound transport system permease large subunit